MSVDRSIHQSIKYLNDVVNCGQIETENRGNVTNFHHSQGLPGAESAVSEPVTTCFLKIFVSVQRRLQERKVCGFVAVSVAPKEGV